MVLMTDELDPVVAALLELWRWARENETRLGTGHHIIMADSLDDKLEEMLGTRPFAAEEAPHD